MRRLRGQVLLLGALLAFDPAGLVAQTVAVGGAPDAPPDSATSALVGHVSGRFGDEAHILPFAMVEGLTGAVRQRVVTDSSGRYVMTGLPPGEVTLTVTHAGYEPVSLVVVIPRNRTLAVDLELRADPVPLSGLEVSADRRTGGRDGVGAGAEASLTELEMQALEVGPGLGQSGIADVLSALPGNDPGDATDVLFMRGTTTDMKLVLLDGVPVYTPFHVAGLMRSFEPTVLGRAELHVGGAPARFDGGLTHILELSTRSARRDAVHFSGSVDLLSGSGAVEVPLGGRAGVVASARSLHDLASATLGRTPPYGYSDALVSVDFEPTDGQELRATGFWNSESVALDLEPASDDATWSNRAGSVGYRSDLGGPDLEVTAGLSEYRATLPLQPGEDAGGTLPPPLLATAKTERARVVGELLWGSAAAPVRTGVSFERIDADFAARVLDDSEQVTSRGGTSTLGAFVDATRPLADGLSIRAGLRVDHFVGRTTRIAPRASIRWAVAPEALLTIAAGRYHQPTRTPDVDVDRTLAQVAEGAFPPSELLPIATADHVVMSLDQKLNESVRLGLQGFWKSFEGLPGLDGANVRSSGIDVRVLTGSDRATAWLGYGLSWFWSRSDLSGSRTDFTGHHLLSAGLSGTIGGPLRGEARVSFGAGLPYTSVPVGLADPTTTQTSAVIDQSESMTQPSTLGPLASGIDRSFLRLDAELYALLEPSWGGREWRVRPYLRLLNALDRRDALFYAFEPWRSDSVRPLAELPILPLLGVAVSF